MSDGRGMTSRVALTTDRLVIRPVGDADRDWLLGLQTSKAARRHLGGAREQRAAELAVTALLSATWGVLVVDRLDGVRAGVITFDEGRGDLEVSYTFDPHQWGQGFALEAMQAVLPWAAAEYRASSVMAVTQAANIRSLGLLSHLWT